jgi:hypothetical protein
MDPGFRQDDEAERPSPGRRSREAFAGTTKQRGHHQHEKDGLRRNNEIASASPRNQHKKPTKEKTKQKKAAVPKDGGAVQIKP